jgi:hypothetical protein
MKDELQQELYNNYQSLFRDVGKSPMESCMAFGIECGDGWYEILSSLCFLINQHERNIEGQTKYKQKENPDYVSNYHPVIFQQIKQKFGGLRVYYGGGDDYIDGLVSMVEGWSYRTCEVCGERGKPNKSGWIVTLCDNCRNKK